MTNLVSDAWGKWTFQDFATEPVEELIRRFAHISEQRAINLRFGDSLLGHVAIQLTEAGVLLDTAEAIFRQRSKSGGAESRAVLANFLELQGRHEEAARVRSDTSN